MKQKKFCIKKLIIKLMSCVMVSFLVLTASVMPKKENYIIHADTNVKINPFVWLCSYFGINIYTEAQTINDAFYDAISVAYNTYMLSLQPQQRVSIDDIIGSISWDSQQPKMLKISGWAFNTIRAFADWVNSQYYDASGVLGGLPLGQYEIITGGNYLQFDDVQPAFEATTDRYTSFKYTEVAVNDNVRIVAFKYQNSNDCQVYFVSPNKFSVIEQAANQIGTTSGTTRNAISTPITVDGVPYYTSTYSVVNYNSLNQNIPLIITTAYDRAIAVSYTFGSNSNVGGETTLNDIYALPEQALLDDLIGAADPESEVQIDIEDSDIPWSTAATLQDILDAINELTDAYVVGNTWPDVAGLVDAISQSISNQITDVEYPNAITWEVPVIIGTPVITPLLEPECPTLSACLVAGIEDVGTTMSNVIESNSNINNYVSVVLFMGLSLLILGGI